MGARGNVLIDHERGIATLEGIMVEVRDTLSRMENRMESRVNTLTLLVCFNFVVTSLTGAGIVLMVIR